MSTKPRHPRSYSLLRRVALPALLPALLWGCGTTTESRPGAEAEGPAGETGDAAAAEGPSSLSGAVSSGTVLGIRGTGGVRSPDLPEGTFLGEGGKLGPGQRIEVPKGTRAEIELENGVKLRIDEDSALTMPSSDAPNELTLTKGEVVVLAQRVAGMKVRNDAEVVEVLAGELLVRNRDGKRQYSVLDGAAAVSTGGHDIPLGPGARLELPTPAKAGSEAPPNDPNEPPKPALTLEPLREASWARSFETAKVIATDVPPGVGSLVARRAGSKVERQNLRLVDQTIQVDISGRIAHTRIEQAFHNDSGTTMEGIYQFPLPNQASISGLQLLVGNRWNEGAMVEKQRGRQIFRQIVDATVPRDPALLQWDQGNLFKLNIFPIPGHGERRVRLSYTETLPMVGDQLRYRYPMGSTGASDTEIDHFSFTMRVDGTQLTQEQIDGLSTPMATLQRNQRGSVIELSTRVDGFRPTHEFGIDIPIAEDSQRVTTQAYTDRDGQSYFMVNLRPQFEISGEGGRRAVDYAIVLDRSHGTTPELWSVGVGLTKAMIAGMDEGDRATVLACDTACDALPGGLKSTGGWQDADYDRFLGEQVLAGASDLGAMLEAADGALSQDRRDAERIVVYVGDGVPTSGELTPDGLSRFVSRELPDTRIQAVALGARSDMLVLDSLTRLTGGDVLRADTRDDLDRLAREMAVRAQVPAARGLELELPRELVSVYPRDLPAIRPGETLTVVGKIRPGVSREVLGDIHLRGRAGSESFSESFPVVLDPHGTPINSPQAHLPRTWAQHEIEHLTATRGYSAHDEIVSLSKEFTVLSRYTALIVLENDRMYREFGVKRRARDKNEWKGELAEAENTPMAETASEATTGSEAKPSEAAPLEEVDEREKRDEERSREPYPTFDEDQDRAATETAKREKAPESVPGGTPGGVPGGVPGNAPAPAPTPDPFPGDDAKDSFGADEAEESEPDADWHDDPAPDSGNRAGPSKPKPSPKKKSKAKSKPSSSKGGGKAMDLFDDFGGGGGSSSTSYKKRHYPRIRVTTHSGPSTRALAKVADLKARRDANPGDRAAQRRLVRAAIEAGDPQAEVYAAAWAAADPDRGEALTAHADALATIGNPAAMRAYASAAEANPFSTRVHERLAKAFSSKGDLARACSHRRALVSIDPARGTNHAKLVRCLHRAGNLRSAEQALADGELRSKRDKGSLRSASKELAGSPIQPRSGLHSYPELKVTATWSGDVDVDIAIVDRRGRRLSAMRPETIRVREEAGRETVTMAMLNNPVHIELSRNGDGPPVHVTLTVRTDYGKKTFDVTLDRPTKRIARAAWN